MSTFTYTALTPQGKTKKGTVRAQNPTEADRLIKKQGIFPTKVQITTTPQSSFLEKKLSLYRLTLLTRQLAALTDSGVSLTRSIKILLEQERHSFTSHLLHSIHHSLEHGHSLSESLAQHPAVFNTLYTGMIQAGEKSGRIPLMLSHLADFLEQNLKLRRKITSSLFYPAVVLCLTAGVFVLLVTFILPRFQSVFTNILNNRPLPPLTQSLFTMGDFLRNNASWILLITLTLFLLLPIASRFSSRFSIWIDSFKLNFPLWSSFYKKLTTVRLTRTLSILLSSGIPLATALKITEETSHNRRVASAIRQINSRIREGDSLSVAIRSTGIFSPMTAGMIQVGEETGKLSEMLQKISSNYDEETQSATTFFTTILEPTLIITLAFIVITVIIALFTPLMTLISELSTAY